MMRKTPEVFGPPSPNPFFRYDALFRKYGFLRGVDPAHLKALALNESSLGQARSVRVGEENPSDTDGSKSSDGKSWGLMQFTLATARDYVSDATPEKLNDAEFSVQLAARFVSDLQKRFIKSDPRYLEWIIKSYNQGARNTARERLGQSDGFTGDYWPRFQRNLALVISKGGI